MSNNYFRFDSVRCRCKASVTDTRWQGRSGGANLPARCSHTQGQYARLRFRYGCVLLGFTQSYDDPGPGVKHLEAPAQTVMSFFSVQKISTFAPLSLGHAWSCIPALLNFRLRRRTRAHFSPSCFFPLKVEYSLTGLERSLCDLVGGLCGWAKANIEQVQAARKMHVRTAREDSIPH
jgi:hypothetical protein